jgi:hypothetical protein
MPFYRDHPMLGPKYGDFHVEKQWTRAMPKILCLHQGWNAFLQLEIHEFVPPIDDHPVDLKGRSMYAVPWAIKDPDAATTAVNEYIDNNIQNYMQSILSRTDRLLWNIFDAAYGASVFPVPVSYDPCLICCTISTLD